MHPRRELTSLLVLSIIVVGACVSRVPAGSTAHLRCPEHDIELFVDSTHTISNIDLAENIDEIPEFHDCQRFPATGSATEYGPLVAIWAVENLAAAFDDDVAAVASGSTDTPWRAVAQIFDYGADYEPLHIRRYFNCLQLRRVRPSREAPDGWMARVVPIGKNPKNCQPVSRDTALAGALEVRATAADPAELPPVARWDLESGARARQYVGIRCGDAWCEVGPRGFRPSRPVLGSEIGEAYGKEAGAVAAAGPDPAKLRVIRVKGWYDQQPLARLVAGKLRRTDVMGTIIPDPGLGAISDPGSFDGKWIPAAYVHVTAPYKWFEAPATGRLLNRISVCRESGSARCPDVPASLTCPMSGGGRWLAAIVGPSSVPTYTCVHYDGSPGVIPAAAARWRWLEDDETTWVRCAGGCCSTR